MNPLSLGHIASYWARDELGANIVIMMNLVGALGLGAFVGYERTYRSRAAGMRTLGLVCMGSTALTAICGYAPLWHGGGLGITAGADTTRVIQGLITGIGFLGAGVIMKDGAQISGLTTAATIWVVAAIGILIGAGLYAAAIALAVFSTAFTMWGARFEAKLPSQSALIVSLKFSIGAKVDESQLRDFFKESGYMIARDSISIAAQDGVIEWRFVAIGQRRRHAMTIPVLAEQITSLTNVKHCNLAYARN
jgi:putative Mg2+ transporter-C (MgtC) family protein